MLGMRSRQTEKPPGRAGRQGGRRRRSGEELRCDSECWQLAYFLALVAFGLASFFGVFEDGDFAVSPVWTDPCWI
jgi:hypothetical protein